MPIHARGQLQHHFWGDYKASIGLLFHSSELASEALPALEGFKVHPVDPRALTYFGGGADLKRVEALLVSHGANRKLLTSVAKSIDYGEPFVIWVKRVDGEPTFTQPSLLEA